MVSAGGVRIPLQVSHGCVIASVQVDLTSDVIGSLQDDVLDLIRDSGSAGLVIDISGVDALDPEEFVALRRVAQMVRLLGARPVMSGFRPGVVSALMDLDVDVSDVEAARTTDDAIEMIQAESDDTQAAPGAPRRIIDDLDSDETDDSDPI